MLEIAARQIHSPQPKVMHRAHTEMFLAAASQRWCRDVEGGADFLKVDCTVIILIQPFPETRHDLLVAMPSGPAALVSSTREARDHGNREKLLQRSHDFGMIERRFSRESDLFHFTMELSQSVQVLRRRLHP